ncbi:hypothetical protein GALMADRAFT_220215 [Galerina marginata CBS 339.88]|uniref:Transmembrane protein n=1 Tax=Galerina marginata (strain CBS 339.88) TaxID=685588 RepID=A0A067TMW9_GALM3|nr:hypothetical protein GALMADRAFT_220215 [Galerina marginata CBS 339.88]
MAQTLKRRKPTTAVSSSSRTCIHVIIFLAVLLAADANANTHAIRISDSVFNIDVRYSQDSSTFVHAPVSSLSLFKFVLGC